MAAVPYRYLTCDPDRHGNVRYYYRRPGAKKIRIRGEPGSDEFQASYKAASEGRSTPKVRTAAPLPGSFRMACAAYYGSTEFAALDISTRKWRRRALDAVALESFENGISHGDKPIRMMEPKHVRKIRDAKVTTPGAANTRLKALRALFAWSIEHEFADRDPTRDVKRLRYKTTGHHSWTLEEVAQFEARHPVGTKARLAMAIILFTTGRREDAVRLGRQHRKNGRFRFVQAKNEDRAPVEIDIPVHQGLAAVIDATPSEHLTFLVTEYGKPFTAPGFGNKFRTWCDQAGLPHCSAHGLRKATAAKLAEAGASAHEIMAITGHQTLEEVERYTKAARNRVLADSAMAKLTT